MALVPGLLPPSYETWTLLSTLFQFFPLVAIVQLLTEWYPQGKTSIASRFNLPGKPAWIAMELPGAAVLLYNMLHLPAQTSGVHAPLPWGNWTMAGMYVVHYAYRAVLSPLLNPSMSPIHVSVFLAAAGFNVVNATVLSGWLAGYGPTTVADWAGRTMAMQVGLVVWGWALLGNIFHDDELREIRRAAKRRLAREAAAEQDSNKDGDGDEDGKHGKKAAEGVEKHYQVPRNGLFNFVLYPHYLCEWIEWAGFWAVGGWACVPARSFLLAEIATMLPRALQGRRWYIRRFGREAVGNRKAIIPGLL